MVVNFKSRHIAPSEGEPRGPLESKGKRKFLVNPAFQLRFVAWVYGLIAVASGVFYGAIFRFFESFEQLGRAAGLPREHVIFQFLNAQRSHLEELFLWSGLGVFALAGLWAVWFSHRVAGPLHRLRGHMEQIAMGKTPGDIRFRKNDFFQELGSAYNRQNARLQSVEGAPALVESAKDPAA